MKYIIPILLLLTVFTSCRKSGYPYKTYEEQLKAYPPVQYVPLSDEELEKFRKEYHPITNELKSNGMNNYIEE